MKKIQKFIFIFRGLVFLIFTLIFTLSLNLSGCASTLKNHENDYMHQEVSERPVPVAPSGLNNIKTQPVFIIPPGPTSYPAEKSNVNLKPPTLNS